MPIRITGDFLSQGITVVVRTPPTKNFFKKILPDPEGGFVAVATAKIGIAIENGPVGITDNPPARMFDLLWSARLVPTDVGVKADLAAARWKSVNIGGKPE